MIPKNADFSQLLGKGENPSGMIAQTPNGTERDGVGSDGREWQWGAPNGVRWNKNPMPEAPPLQTIPIEVETLETRPGQVRVNAHFRKRRK